MCILRHYTWEDVNKCLSISNRDLMTDFKDTIKVQFGEQQWVLLALIIGMWMSGYLPKDKQQKNSWFIKVYPSICGSSQKLETGTLESSTVRERPSYSSVVWAFFRHLYWFLLLSSASSRCLSMFESLIFSFSAYLLLGSKEFSEFGYFQGNDKFQGLPIIICFPVSWGIKKKKIFLNKYNPLRKS